MNILFDSSLGRAILYIDGYLQFDAADEALYHESLALPALCLASRSVEQEISTVAKDSILAQLPNAANATPLPVAGFRIPPKGSEAKRNREGVVEFRFPNPAEGKWNAVSGSRQREVQRSGTGMEPGRTGGEGRPLNVPSPLPNNVRPAQANRMQCNAFDAERAVEQPGQTGNQVSPTHSLALKGRKHPSPGCRLWPEPWVERPTDNSPVRATSAPQIWDNTPSSVASKRVLICGGGDGLALREVLRFPGVSEVDLVDYSSEVLDLGRTKLSEINHHAFDDPRVTVHVANALEFVASANPYDVIVCDFTFPTSPEEARLFDREWFEALKALLLPGGTIAINAVSPQNTPDAFACLVRTVRSAGLSTLPYRVCIPSFRDEGYGAWGFLLASTRHISAQEFRNLRCPVPTQQADLRRLWRGARFSREERDRFRTAPIHTGIAIDLSLEQAAKSRPFPAGKCCITYPLSIAAKESPLALLTIAPQATPLSFAREVGELRRTGREGNNDQSQKSTPEARDYAKQKKSLKLTTPLNSIAAPSFLKLLEPKQAPLIDGLIAEIAPQHASHTYQMVQELAQQVCGSIHTLDLRRLIDELWKRVHLLPERLQQELARIRDFIGDRFFRAQDYATWSSRIFAALVIVMTLANTLAPDNAFGKGAHGIGHSSFSRGFEGEGSMHGTFATRTATAEPMALRGSGFRSSYGRDPIDVYGQPYPMRPFYYHSFGYGYYGGGGYGGGPYGSGGGNNNPPPPGGNQQDQQNQHQPLFVADDDLIVMDNGDAVITLSPDVFAVVSGGQVHLMSHDQPTPLAGLYADPALLENIRMQIADQAATVKLEIANRREWLAWVGWTDSMFAVVRSEQTELANLRSLDKKLTLCYNQIGEPKEDARIHVPPDAVEIFVGCYLMKDGSLAMFSPMGQQRELDVDTLNKNQPELAKALRSVIDKLTTELQADLKQNEADFKQASLDYASDENDYQQYTQILQSNYNDYSYEVDYGTDSIPVSTALSKTQADMDAIKLDAEQIQKDRATNLDQLQRLNELSQKISS